MKTPQSLLFVLINVLIYFSCVSYLGLKDLALLAVKVRLFWLATRVWVGPVSLYYYLVSSVECAMQWLT